MARKSQHAPETMRRMIVDAAEAIVAEGGLSKLSAREVAQRIGYSPGTLYNIFENLDEVILNVEARVLDRLDQRLVSALQASQDPPEEDLFALANAYLAFTQDNPRLWNLLFEHRMPSNRTLPDWYVRKLDGLLRRIEVALTPYFATSESSAQSRSARVLWAAVHGIASLSTTGKLSIITAQTAAKLVEHLLRTYLRGLTQHGDPELNSPA